MNAHELARIELLLDFGNGLIDAVVLDRRGGERELVFGVEVSDADSSMNSTRSPVREDNRSG